MRPIRIVAFTETAEKEVKDISCRGSGGIPQLYKSPKTGGLGGFIEIILTVSYTFANR